MAKRTVALDLNLPVGDLVTELLADMKKSFKDDSIVSYLDAKKDVVKNWYSTGILSLDVALGGGLAGGQCSMAYGPKSAGKSTTSYSAIAAAQQQFPDKIHILADPENSALDAEAHMRKLGVDVESPNFIMIKKPEGKPLYAEDLFERLEALIKNPRVRGRLGLVVIDSIGALVSGTEAEKDDKWDKASRVGGYVTLINKFLDGVQGSGILYDVGAHILFLNQIRDNIGNMWVEFRTPGGRQLEHACVQMIEFSRNMGSDFHNPAYKEGNPLESRFVGQKIKYKITKNKVGGKEGATANANYFYEEGLDLYADVITLAGHVGLMEGTSWKTLINPLTGEVIGKYQGVEKWKEALHEDEQLWAKLYTMTQLAARGATPEEIDAALTEIDDSIQEEVDALVGESNGNSAETEQLQEA